MAEKRLRSRGCTMGCAHGRKPPAQVLRSRSGTMGSAAVNRGSLVLLLALLGACSDQSLEHVPLEHAALHGYAALPYPEDSVAFMRARVPPLRAGSSSQFLVEISGLLQNVEYVLHAEWVQVGSATDYYAEQVPLRFETAPADPCLVVLRSPWLRAGTYTLTLDLLDAFPGHGSYHDVLLAQRSIRVHVPQTSLDHVLITAVQIAAPHPPPLPIAADDPHAADDRQRERGCAQMGMGEPTRMVATLSRAPPAGSRMHRMHYLWSRFRV